MTILGWLAKGIARVAMKTGEIVYETISSIARSPTRKWRHASSERRLNEQMLLFWYLADYIV